MEVQAAYTPRLGSPELITYGPVDIEDPSSDDVVIATHAVALNPVDTYVRSGTYVTAVPLPLVLGRDVVGVVEQAPANSSFYVGQWVWANSLGYQGRQGSFATKVVVSRDRVYPLESGVDPIEMAALAHPGSTAALAFARVKCGIGTQVFIGGAGGNVGGAAVAFAVAQGARVVANCSEADMDRVKQIGAHEVVDYHRDGEEIAQLFPHGADVVWDCSGMMDYSDLATIAGVGAHILVTAAHQSPSPVPWAQLYTRDISVKGFVHSRANADELRQAAHQLNTMMARKLLLTPAIQRHPLDEARWGHEQMEAGHVRGRIVLQP